MNMDSTRPLNIHGHEITSGQIMARAFAALVCIFLGVKCANLARTASDSDLTSLCVVGTALFLVAALALPYLRHVYLDFNGRQIVERTQYGWLCKQTCRPLGNFTKIIVRHVSHDAEGGPTYTGSVGLTPADHGTVLWVKEFPATEDAAPAEAIEFARALQVATGMPLTTPWTAAERANEPRKWD